jgi:Peptidase A4 family
MSENDRYETYEEVPEGCNLLDASPGQLDLYGIPQKPDAVAEPLLFAFWKKLVSPPFYPRPPKFIFDRQSFRTSPSGALQSSLNWSGALVSPPRPKRFVFAVAGWIAPDVKRPLASALFTHDDIPKCLVWVGLDGHNGALPKISLPQIGTAHRPDGPVEDRHFAWWYWWHQGSKEPVTQIDDFDIDPGDEILAGLQVLISQDILFFIKNQRTGEFRGFLVKPPRADIEPLGSSAEWVVERPTDPGSGQPYPLAAYSTPPTTPLADGHIDFKHCFAVAADGPVTREARMITLADNGRIIKMREAFADPYRTVYVSRAKRRPDPDGSVGVTCTFHEPLQICGH